MRSYLNIQGIRYQDKLRYQIDAEEQLLDCQVLKLLLQPLVENAIYHGIKEKKGAGLIRITVKSGECCGKPAVWMTVWDDGAGIPREKLDRINEGLENGANRTGEGYGIYNVNERILLYYGSGYGLSYESEEGSCTKATLVIPANHREVE